MFLGTSVVMLALCACRPEAEGDVQHRKHALLIVVDTLRADAVERAHTPAFDGILRRGDSPERAWSPATWTAPGVVSLFTGAQVREHGWDLPFPQYMSNWQESYPPVPDLPLLAQVLGEAGFGTAGIYGNALLGGDLGFDRGFDRWTFVRDERTPEAVRKEVIGWTDGRRHLLYVHLYGTHQPLHPSAAAQARWGLDDSSLRSLRGLGHLRARRRGEGGLELYRRAYHAVLEDTDGVIAQILASLGPLRDDTAIVLTSDHGELLGEHGLLGHDHEVWEPLTHVPLVAEGVGPLPPTMSTAAVPDLLCRALGVSHAWPVTIDDDTPLVSQREGKLAMSPDGRTKTIWDVESFAAGQATFDLDTDPGEEWPLSGHEEEMAWERFTWERTVPQTTLLPTDAALQGDLQQALEALGYMDGSEP